MVGTIAFSRRGSQETFADQLIGLQGLLSKIEALHGDLQRRERETPRQTRQPALQVITLTGGERRPCFDLSDERAPLLTFADSHLRHEFFPSVCELRVAGSETAAQDGADMPTPQVDLVNATAHVRSCLLQAYTHMLATQRRARVSDAADCLRGKPAAHTTHRHRPKR